MDACIAEPSPQTNAPAPQFMRSLKRLPEPSMLSPNMPQARVNTRVIMNPENAKNLLFALRDNIQKYENTFGEIEHKVARNNAPAPENPFQA